MSQSPHTMSAIGGAGTECRLTKQERACLEAAQEWIAPFEVASVIHPKGSSIRQRRSIDTTMKSLRDKYLLRFGSQNGTYRITDRGIAALRAHAKGYSHV